MKIMNAPGRGNSFLLRGLLSLLTAVVTVLGLSAAPARADHLSIHHDFSGENWSGGIRRAHAYGGYYAHNVSPGYEIYIGDLWVYDDSADGYRGRVWFNIFSGDSTDRSRLLYSRVFDNTKGSGTVQYHDGTTSRYNVAGYYSVTVEIKVGRYDGDSGAYTSTVMVRDYILT